MKLSEAESWLDGRINHERAPGYSGARLDLSPIRALLDGLGHPERGLRVLHVAGSKGKGSVALISEALCEAVGLRTGVFTSPHLERWTERFRIDGAEVSGERLGEAVARVRPVAEALDAGPDAPTWFDVTTAAALCLFAEARVDVAILEVGLGGRLDSTNVVLPAVCCITSIELEHTERLGTTHAAIAGEKAGILKPGVPCVVGRLSPEALGAVEKRAAEVGAPLHREGAEIALATTGRGIEGSTLTLADGALRLEVEVAAPGPHQARNAGLALACVHRLLPDRSDELRAAAGAVLPRLQVPGRVEIVGREPMRVVDAAHTEASLRALMEVLSGVPRERAHAVLSISEGKDLALLCEILAPGFDHFTLTRAEPTRSAAPEALRDLLAAKASGARIDVEPDPERALSVALSTAGPRDLLCATGSFYLAGPARRRWAEPSDGG